MLYYDYAAKHFTHVNDVSWIFRSISCTDETPLTIPMEGLEVFRHIHMIDEQARKEILTAINTPFESKRTQDIKSKYQKELYNEIYSAYKNGKVPLDEVSSVYKILTKGNYSAWEKEFKDLHEKFQRDQNIHFLLMSLSKLFHEFKIESRITTEVKKLGPEDLVLVGCMFLVNPSFKEWNMLSV